MKRNGTALSVGVALMFGVTGVASAQSAAEDPLIDERADEETPYVEDQQLEEDTQLQEPMAQGDHGEEKGALLRATEVVDYEVRDAQGQVIGHMDELAVDTQHGQIAYGILTLEDEAQEQAQVQEDDEGVLETLGLRSHRYLVPWQAFRALEHEEALELTIDREQLSQLEPFDDNWDQLSDQQWATQHHQTLGLSPYWEGGQERQGLGDQPGADGMAGAEAEIDVETEDRQVEADADAGLDVEVDRQASLDGSLRVQALDDLRGYEIRNAEDEGLASIDDLVIDTRDGHLAYAVLSYGGVLGVGDSYAAVPYQALQPHAEDEEVFVLNADEGTLDAVAFEGDAWPDMTDQQWAQRTHDTFNEEPYWQVHGYSAPGEATEQGEGLQPEESHDLHMDEGDDALESDQMQDDEVLQE